MTRAEARGVHGIGAQPRPWLRTASPGCSSRSAMQPVALLFLLAGAACGRSSGGGQACSDCSQQGGKRWPPNRPGYQSPIAAENALQGEADWGAGREADARQVELYLDRVSVRAGTAVQLMASSDSPHMAFWALYRFGWYGGAGARRIAGDGPVPVAPQPSCPMAPATGLVRCSWSSTATVPVPLDAVSGLYAVKITRDDGFMRFAPLVVVDDRPSDLLLQASVDTYQAYNSWGGESLYTDASGKMPGGKAVQVSFDRPYAANGGFSDMARNEVPFARFLERHGYDVGYTSNLDVARSGVAHLIRSGAFLSVGHDEYWAGEERDAVQAARDAGVPLLFFGANAAYWKIRYEGFAGDAGPRVITCYKGRTQDDPVQGPGVTARYRDPPINRPETALIGAMYASYQIDTFPWVAGDAQSWLLAGTGMKAGDAIPLLVGNEYDRTFPHEFEEPAGLQILARSPLVDARGLHDRSETVSYRAAASDALVFDAATIYWSHGLDLGSPAHDPRIERMTANVLAEALGLPIPKSLAQ